METPMDTKQDLIADPSNAGQVGAWDGNEGAFWTAQAQRFDETLANCHGPFLTAAAVRERDRVLDVGCGNGQTTHDARVATNGSALGVDLSLRLTSRDRHRGRSRQRRIRHADAQIYPFEAATFDVVISRMGSMFFGDPIAAFTNLHRVRAEGRLTLLTWQGVTDNEWLTEFRAAMAVSRDLPNATPRRPQPVRALRPRSRANHPGSCRLRRHRLPKPSRTDELRTQPRRHVRLRQRSDRLDARRSRPSGPRRRSQPSAPRSPDTPATTESRTNPPPGSFRRTNPDLLDGDRRARWIPPRRVDGRGCGRGHAPGDRIGRMCLRFVGVGIASRAVYDQRSHNERAGAARDRSACDHRHRPFPLVGRRHCDRAGERLAAARRGECARRRVRRAKSGGRRRHRRHQHRVRPRQHPSGSGRAQRCRHGAARLQRRSRTATPAHRPQQRRRARGRRPLPPTAGAATGPQRHDRVTRCVHEPGRTPRLTHRAQRW